MCCYGYFTIITLRKYATCGVHIKNMSTCSVLCYWLTSSFLVRYSQKQWIISRKQKLEWLRGGFSSRIGRKEEENYALFHECSPTNQRWLRSPHGNVQLWCSSAETHRAWRLSVLSTSRAKGITATRRWGSQKGRPGEWLLLLLQSMSHTVGSLEKWLDYRELEEFTH